MVCPYMHTVRVKKVDENGYNYFEPLLVPCGKCYACRTNLVNSWTSRFLAEQATSEFCYFVTLTYSDEKLHYNDNQRESVSKRHVQLYLKLLRKDQTETSFRYYCCAEYGGRTARPHYHVLMFCTGGSESIIKSAIRERWPHGGVHIGSVRPASIRYCSNFHVYKGDTPDGSDDTFALMSRRPGIGAHYLDSRLDQFRSPERRYFVMDGIKYPFPRYFTKRYKDQTGLDSPHKEFSYTEIRDRLEATKDSSLTLQQFYDHLHMEDSLKMKLKKQRHNKL